VATKAAHDGFPEYCVVIDPKYQLEWFHQQIALKLEEAIKRVENGEDVRLMIFMPPRHGKSDTATQKFPSWVLGRHPEWPFIVASYSQELATDFGQGTRDLMESDNYKAVFETRLRADTQAKAKWMTDEKGGYTAVGVGGAITGRGFKVGIVDDPFKNREEADSPVTREGVHKWWRSTFYTRQEGNTLIVLILTRWHDDDLAGRLLKEQQEAEKFGEDNIDKWEVLQFKAIAEEEELHRKMGAALWPKKFSVPKLMRTKASLGGYEWSALYQQNPIDEANQEFKREWLQYKTFEEVGKMTTRKFATIDTALSKNAKSDFTGVTRNYVSDNNDWHFRSTRYRISSKQLIDLVFTLHTEGLIGIEEGAYISAVEPFLKDEMNARGVYPNVVPLKHGGTMKETRIRGLIPRYQNKKIFHIVGECTDLEEEYLRFPKAVHDDCLDSAAYQNHVAAPPAAGVGDRLTYTDLEQNLTSAVNSQEGTIIIGISTATPIHYVVGNKEGVFFNRNCKNVKKPYEEIETLIRRWTNVFIIADQVGDTLGLKELQDKYPGKIIIAWLKTDPTSQNIVKWGDGDSYGQVNVGKSAVIQMLIDELRDTRLPLSGTREDWQPMIDEFVNLYRKWEINAIGERESSWDSSGPQNYIKSMIFFRVGMSRYATSEAVIVGNDMLAHLPTAKIFNDGLTF